MDNVLFVIAVYVGGFTLVTGIHELARYFVARLSGVQTRAFSIGLGPEMMGYGKEPSIRWSLKWLPTGFFTHLLNDKSIYSYSQKAPGVRAAIIASGPLSLFIVSYLLFWFSAQLIGTYQNQPVVGQILPGLPAMNGGLKQNDKVLSINDIKINNFFDIAQHVQKSGGKSLSFKVQRGQNELDLSVTPAHRILRDQSKVYYIGLMASTDPAHRVLLDVSPVEAVKIAGNRVVQSGLVVFQYVYQQLIGAPKTYTLSGPMQQAGANKVKTVGPALHLIAFVLAVWGGVLVLLFPFIMAWDIYSVRKKLRAGQ